MKILKFDSKEAWLEARKGLIMGSDLKEVYTKKPTERKKGFYGLIVDRIALPESPETPAGESAMERGNRLEPAALERYENETGEVLEKEKTMWVREDVNMGVTPDAVVAKTDNTEAVEAKCLSSEKHIEAYLTKEIPDDYKYQKLQYFLVNEGLKKLTFVFYDDRLAFANYFTIVVTREDVLPELEDMMIYERKTLAEVDDIVNLITSF
jgi:hypothetical protein